jgi:protein SMG6
MQTNCRDIGMVVAALVKGGFTKFRLRKKKLPSSSSFGKSASDSPAARIDDSPSPSIGVAAVRLLDVEPEKWNIAKDWYDAGLAEQPGTGKLHHHLRLLSQEVEGEGLRGVYHFVKR